jgi:predicted nicotinamide N-methyase
MHGTFPPDGSKETPLQPWLAAMVDFFHDQTQSTRMPYLPDLVLRLAVESLPLWERVEQELNTPEAGPPYWAFAWAGGQALARHLLDHPQLVAGRRVLDLGSGSGLVAIAAAKAGAKHVIANDIDILAVIATSLNADANHVEIEARTVNLLAPDIALDLATIDVLVMGDIFYDPSLAPAVMALIQRCRDAGRLVLVGDPGRAELPTPSFAKVGEHAVPVTCGCEYLAAAIDGGRHGVPDIIVGTVWTPA